jgi:NAD(P)-dependent dehydrogenase (short-subunit alcohol dehydrogenase family)
VKHGLIVGGKSEGGIGQACESWFSVDPRFNSVNWYVPSAEELDVRNDNHINDYIERADEHGVSGFDYVVYAAGVNGLCWADELYMLEMVDLFKVNVFGFISLLGQIRATWPGKNFSAVAISSDAAYTPMRGSVNYCASKAALDMAVKTLAREWNVPEELEKGSVRVNAVAPGMVEDTPMSRYIEETVPSFRGWTAEKALAYEQSMQPMGRRADKAEVAHLVADVLYGPNYLNGAIVPLTGAK